MLLKIRHIQWRIFSIYLAGPKASPREIGADLCCNDPLELVQVLTDEAMRPLRAGRSSAPPSAFNQAAAAARHKTRRTDNSFLSKAPRIPRGFVLWHRASARWSPANDQQPRPTAPFAEHWAEARCHDTFKYERPTNNRCPSHFSARSGTNKANLLAVIPVYSFSRLSRRRAFIY